MTLALVLGAFCVGVVVGAVLDDAWSLYRSSRKDSRMWKPRLPRLTIRQLVVLLLFASLANFVLAFLLLATRYTEQQAEDDNRADAVTQCLNANEARAANLLLWNTVLDPANREEQPTPEELERIDAFREWVAALFAPRDCSDLSKRYEIPDPPSLAP